MEYIAGELSEGDKSLEFGTIGEVIHYSDVATQAERVVFECAGGEADLDAGEYVQVRA